MSNLFFISSLPRHNNTDISNDFFTANSQPSSILTYELCKQPLRLQNLSFRRRWDEFFAARVEIKQADHLPERLEGFPRGNGGVDVDVHTAKRGCGFRDVLYQFTLKVGAEGHVGQDGVKVRCERPALVR